MDGLKIAAAMWPGHAALVGVLILKNQTLDPIMEASIYVLLGVCLALAAFVTLTNLFAEPPDQTHPD